MKQSIRLFTIGFTRKSAEKFFSLLEDAQVRRVLDIRLHNASQLAGFAKRDDLRFFLKRIAGISYTHLPLLAPDEELLRGFQQKQIAWSVYEQKFQQLLTVRAVSRQFQPAEFDHACLLCSEPTPDHCHRRLVAEHLQSKWKQIEIHHLM